MSECVQRISGKDCLGGRLSCLAVFFRLFVGCTAVYVLGLYLFLMSVDCNIVLFVPGTTLFSRALYVV